MGSANVCSRHALFELSAVLLVNTNQIRTQYSFTSTSCYAGMLIIMALSLKVVSMPHPYLRHSYTGFGGDSPDVARSLRREELQSRTSRTLRASSFLPPPERFSFRHRSCHSAWHTAHLILHDALSRSQSLFHSTQSCVPHILWNHSHIQQISDL